MSIKSEQTKNMTAEERMEQEAMVAEMSPEQQELWRNGFDPDSMGFDGVEGVDDDGCNKTED